MSVCVFFRSKKMKTAIAPPILSPSCVPQSNTITQCFTTAFKCYELLYSTTELQRGRVYYHRKIIDIKVKLMNYG